MMYKGLAYLLAANMEALALFLGAWWSAGWLDQHYPKSFSWTLVTFPTALVVMVHSGYVIYKMLAQEQKEAG